MEVKHTFQNDETGRVNERVMEKEMYICRRLTESKTFFAERVLCVNIGIQNARTHTNTHVHTFIRLLPCSGLQNWNKIDDYA